MRILLADGQSKVRFALRVLLECQPGVVVVGEAADAEDFLGQTEEICPDMVLLAWELPGLVPSDDLVRRFCQQSRPARTATDSHPDRLS
jgi:DNA-binding NarL/FixJ family response regulator